MAALLSLCLLLAAIGCGGEGRLSKGEYSARVSRICSETTARLNALGHFSFANFKEYGDRAVRYWRRGLRRIEALEPPDELEAAAARFTRSSRAILGELDAATAAAKRNDHSSFQAALGRAAAAGGINAVAARQIGARGCGG